MQEIGAKDEVVAVMLLARGCGDRLPILLIHDIESLGPLDLVVRNERFVFAILIRAPRRRRRDRLVNLFRPVLITLGRLDRFDPVSIDLSKEDRVRARSGREFEDPERGRRLGEIGGEDGEERFAEAVFEA